MIEYTPSVTEQVHITEMRYGQEVTHSFVLNTQRPSEVVTDLQPELANQLLAQEQAVLAAHNAKIDRYQQKPHKGEAVKNLRNLGIAAGGLTLYLFGAVAEHDSFADAAAVGLVTGGYAYVAIGEYIPRTRLSKLRQERKAIQRRINVLKPHATQLPLPAKELEPVQE
jgi:hypothetical protein